MKVTQRERKSIFVFDHFDGEAFNHLAQHGNRSVVTSQIIEHSQVANLGFPIWCGNLLSGQAKFSQKNYMKMKKIGPGDVYLKYYYVDPPLPDNLFNCFGV